MRILVVYHQALKNDRNTIDEHLYSFKRYSGEQCFYLNAAFGIPRYLTKIRFDLIIYHYAFCGLKWGGENRFKLQLEKYQTLKQLSGYKIAIPQDEYVHSISICKFFRDFGVKTVFTCLPESEWQKVYPKELSGLDYYFTVLTGYVDENALKKIARWTRNKRKRGVDVGYRARKVPYWLGRHGLIKWQLTEEFLKAAANSRLKLNVTNNPQKVFHRKRWYKFLADCRVVLGCEGGASLHDPDGNIRKSVEQYVSEHPDANFDEVEKACFPGLDGNLKLYAISPRHFEACLTRTCQALVEGEYAGIFKPGLHHIEIKNDWSNIPHVIKKIKDKDYCRLIAENAYRDIVESGLYTYRQFVHHIIGHVKKVWPMEPSRKDEGWLYLRLLDLRNAFPFLFSPLRFFYWRSCKIMSNFLMQPGFQKPLLKFKKWLFRVTPKYLFNRLN